MADADDLVFVEDDPAALGENRGSNGSEIVDPDGALVPGAPASGDRQRPLAERSVNAGVGGRTGMDHVEVGRSPRLEAPAEDALVEAAGSLDVIGGNVEMRDVVGHGGIVIQRASTVF